VARNKPNSCIGCGCFSHGTDFTQVEGTGSSGVMLVGEASGEHEQRAGTPFVSYAPAGGVLERVLRRMGVAREAFSVTNVLRCRPRNNWLEGAPWEYSAISHCRPNLEGAIAERRPRALVALGGTATRELTGLAGDKQGVSYLSGYVLSGPNGTPTISSFHPSFLRRGAIHLMGVLARNITRALNVAKGTDTP
jgi:uracil-DNA glycosylase